MGSETNLRILLSSGEIQAGVGRLAEDIGRDYRGKAPLLIGILKGSFMFMADLIRLLDFPLRVEFIGVSSYGSGTESSGSIKIGPALRIPIKGRDVLVVEDIVDSGLTTSFVLEYLRKKRPASLKLCALADKPSRRQVPVNIDYLGFTVPNKFLVGYGLDWNQKFRNLPDICFIEEEC